MRRDRRASDAPKPRQHPRRRPRRVGALLRGVPRHGASSDCEVQAAGFVVATRRPTGPPLRTRGHAGSALPPHRAGRRRLRGRPSGWVQMYIRDPAGNLVEIDWPDASTLDAALVAELYPLEADVPQAGGARPPPPYTN